MTVKELVEGELSDYGYFQIRDYIWNDAYGEYDEQDEEEHYAVSITMSDKTKVLAFNYNKKEDKIEIELGEDSWQEVDDYSHNIKYFWMALLTW
jgi:hypothetical protein